MTATLTLTPAQALAHWLKFAATLSLTSSAVAVLGAMLWKAATHA